MRTEALSKRKKKKQDFMKTHACACHALQTDWLYMYGELQGTALNTVCTLGIKYGLCKYKIWITDKVWNTDNRLHGLI